ncbi:DUF805 domain-containing protein [Seminibacterium arietis]|uniref:DUF805 domain-containing protein n=1 Tax=Seminibacterium arietis TaxID=1173502 RepID=A0ABW3I6G5_9PAST
MRRSRLNYFGYSLLTFFLMNISLTMISKAIESSTHYYYDDGYYTAITLFTFTIVFLVLHVSIMMYLTRGRLRDIGKSPNWCWTVLIPFAWLYFVFAKPTEGDNQYGKSPKDIKAEEKAKITEQKARANPKIDLVLQYIKQYSTPNVGRVKSIDFRLNEENERYFYAISPVEVEQLRRCLEILAKKLEDDENCYGYLYAKRCFYIGDRLIFSWSS